MILTIFILASISTLLGYYSFYNVDIDNSPPTMVTAITILTAWDMYPWLGITLCSVLGFVWLISMLIRLADKLG